ncbi:beta-galactosidase-1-like protein 2 isoform X1 [Patella vulgata]|uniref:beta-galactosidase-1-like protein 2 isoform X1 n=2 Tax=Patella vulgata TaxID=6465 RepID=UPI0021808669|nr:beta-galactosidase-1-like protein 2 isoform X1 [Patella vulgata]
MMVKGHNNSELFSLRTLRIMYRKLSARTKLGVVIGFIILWFVYRRFYYSHSINMAEPKPIIDGSQGIHTGSQGLHFKNRRFILDGKPLWIISGAMHYFRVVPEYWKDRMLKMKAGGLNTLETYVSWNVHEPLPGMFDFEGILNLRKYIELAQEIGLYVIFRPGPFICSEWDFGGMPSWLLKDPAMKVRSTYGPYQAAVKRFFGKLLPMVEDLQYSKGGPIIAVQVENEFGSYSREVEHLKFIAETLRHYGIQELLVTSDNEQGQSQAPFYHVALPTVNFKEMTDTSFKDIKEWSPDYPLMVMEYWSGWFDHWGTEHHTETVEFHGNIVSSLLKENININFYMYHGGTNFGFMAGANNFGSYKADVTSYDYDAPISEAGDVTPKYIKTRELILQYVLKPQGITNLPEPPPSIPKAAYGKVTILNYLPWTDVLQFVEESVNNPDVLPMEMLTLKSGYGQSYGFIVYQKNINSGGNLVLPLPIKDRAQVLLNSEEVGIVEPNANSASIRLATAQSLNVLDIVVENLGRVNYITQGSNLLNEERKGLSGTVTLNELPVKDWKIYPLDFNKDFIKRLSSSTKWLQFGGVVSRPAVYKTSMVINGQPTDTFLNMMGWKKGIVIINGFNLGRYWDIGPQKTLYVPGPILKSGVNEIIIFEQHHGQGHIIFQSTHDLGPVKSN